MSIKIPFLINSIQTVKPKQDKRWVPDGEDMWFLPCALDLQNQTYSGWWYGTKSSHESEHYHIGISQGIVLSGEMILVCSDKKSSLKKQDGFLLPPETNHTAELIANNGGFLFFGTIVGQTTYLDSNEKLDAHSYYAMIEKYYQQFQIDLSHIAVNS